MSESIKMSYPIAAQFATMRRDGIFTCRFLSQEERDIYYQLVERFQRDYSLTTTVDHLQVQYVALLLLQTIRAADTRNFRAAERLDRDLRGHLHQLNATKRAREGTQPGYTVPESLQHRNECAGLPTCDSRRSADNPAIPNHMRDGKGTLPPGMDLRRIHLRRVRTGRVPHHPLSSIDGQWIDST